MEKAKGIIARIQRRGQDGAVVETRYEWRPECDIFERKLHDYLGAIVMPFENVLQDYGQDVAERVMNGEIVPAERTLDADQKVVACPRNVRFERREYDVVYPFSGTSEDIVRIRES